MIVKKYLADKTKPAVFDNNNELQYTVGKDILYIATKEGDDRTVAWIEEREHEAEHRICVENAKKAFNK